jgi:fumarylpyruvate hydrolase
MTSLFSNIPTAPLAISGDDRSFPVGRVFCIGRNYADHAKEMGAAAEAIFFMKPADAVTMQTRIPYPARTRDLHHEVELVLALGDNAQIIASGVGVDLTRRDLQAAMKAKGAPWEIGKSFDHSAPIGPLRLGPPPTHGSITLSVNGETRQSGELHEMILSPQELLKALSRYFALKPGDLIFSGTPAGVGALHIGDAVCASIDGLPALNFTITGDATS